MLISGGKSESTSAINKRIVRTGGVRVLGMAAPKPQIHVVQNTVVTQQQKISDTSSSNVNSDSTQVNEKPTHDIIENTHEENSEELQKDIPEKENKKEEAEKENAEKRNTEEEKVEKEKENNKQTNKEDINVQRTAQPKKEPRKKRHHHMLSSEVKPVSREPSASALSMVNQPPAERPIPRTIPIPKTETVSQEERDEEDIDNVNATAVADAHDEVCSTPPSNGTRSPDSMQVS